MREFVHFNLKYRRKLSQIVIVNFYLLFLTCAVVVVAAKCVEDGDELVVQSASSYLVHSNHSSLDGLNVVNNGQLSSLNGCMNGGVCKNGTCVCKDGWQGSECQFCGGKVR